MLLAKSNRESKQVKVLYVSNANGISGCEVVFLRHVRANKDVNHSLLAPTSALSDSFVQTGNHYYRSVGMYPLKRSRNKLWPLVGVVRILAGAFDVLRTILRVRPDIIHVNNYSAGLYVAPIALISRIPSIWHIHDIIPPNTLEAKVYRMICKCFTVRLGCSEAVVQRLTELCPSAKALLAHNGIDTNNDFNPARFADVRAEAPESDGTVTVAMVGLLVAWKGFDVYVDAIEKLVREHRLTTNAKFLIVGGSWLDEDEYEQQLKRHVREAGLSEHIVFTGPVKDVPKLLSGVDVLVHASVKPDPFPTVILEGMAMGKIVVAARAGGVPELIDEGNTGFCFPPGRADILADLLEMLVNRHEEFKRVGENAHKVCSQRFNVGRAVARFNQIYTSLAVPDRNTSLTVKV
jgi:glycosyltransferase involved in cell wall biosynthesis